MSNQQKKTAWRGPTEIKITHIDIDSKNTQSKADPMSREDAKTENGSFDRRQTGKTPAEHLTIHRSDSSKSLRSPRSRVSHRSQESADSLSQKGKTKKGRDERSSKKPALTMA